VIFAAVGATSFAHLAQAGVPWALALLAAGAVTVPVGAFVAIPAIRLAGLFLALATFGFGILVERFVFPMGVMFGEDGLAQAPRPDFGIVDGSSAKSFYYVALVVVLLGVGLINLVNRGRLGRLLRGMADSPVGLSTLGTSVNVTRVLVFCISAFLAAVAGALFASFSGTFGGASFPSFNSLLLIVVLAIAGAGELRAPLVAAVALYLVPSYLRSETFNEYLPVLFGVSAIAVAVLSNPDIDLSSRFRGAAERSRRRARSSRIRVRAARVASTATGGR
jgi:ABC-type branched-subunit amino acid transport system permease subunit